jgi:hypothetical protein
VNFFDATERAELVRRIGNLKPDAKPSFGKMNVNQMVVHCTGGIQMMIGELKIAPRRGPFRFPPLRYLIIHTLPWPKGAPTAPELIPPIDPGDFTKNVDSLKAVIDRVGARDPNGHFEEHPAFGKLNAKNLGALMARHLDHHLRQFGA